MKGESSRHKMTKKQKSTVLDDTFYISLLVKAADSVLEIVGGLLVLLISPEAINHTVVALTRHELSQDPHDFVSKHILKVGHDLTTGSGRYFAAFYLLSHGIVKIVIIAALFRQKMWAYLWMIGVLGAFVIYQVYRLVFIKFGIGLLLLTLFDLFVMWLTWREYQKHKILHSEAAE